MWTTKQRADGRWTCENKNLDTTDQSWGSEQEAAAWAVNANANHAARIEANKAKAVARRAKQAELQASMPTDILTSQGDGWEGNCR